MPRERLLEAVGAETDTDVLFRSLRDAAAIGAEIKADPQDPLTAAAAVRDGERGNVGRDDLRLGRHRHGGVAPVTKRSQSGR
jgi:hypothetical protein